MKEKAINTEDIPSINTTSTSKLQNQTQKTANEANVSNEQNEITIFVTPRPILPGVILTEESDYETRKAHMRNEVRSFQFEHLVYDVPQGVEEAARVCLVTYISARIAETYCKTICYSNITDPKQILEKLENIGNPVSSLTGTTIYRHWTSI